LFGLDFLIKIGVVVDVEKGTSKWDKNLETI
jgi:hypothetical protein